MNPIATPARIGDIKNIITSTQIQKTDDLTNIETFVERPSWII